MAYWTGIPIFTQPWSYYLHKRFNLQNTVILSIRPPLVKNYLLEIFSCTRAREWKNSIRNWRNRSNKFKRGFIAPVTSAHQKYAQKHLEGTHRAGTKDALVSLTTDRRAAWGKLVHTIQCKNSSLRSWVAEPIQGTKKIWEEIRFHQIIKPHSQFLSMQKSKSKVSLQPKKPVQAEAIFPNLSHAIVIQ